MSKKHEKKEKVPFGQVIQALQDSSKPFPPKFIYKLADLSQGDLTALKAGWVRVAPERRLNLMQDILDFIESDEIQDFTEIGKIAIKDPDSKVRELGVRILAPYEIVELIPQYISMIENDPAIEVRAITAAALGIFVYLAEIEEIDAKNQEKIEAILKKSCAEGQPDLLRRRSLEALSYSSAEDILPLIEAAYKQPEIDWKTTALNAMSRNLNEKWDPMVLAGLKDLNPAVRAEAAHAAGEMELEGARPILLEMLSDDNDEARSNAIWSLSQIGGEGVSEALETLLDATEDDDLASLLEDALENLEFTEGVAAFDFLDLDEEDDEDGPFDEDTFLSAYNPNGKKPN